MDHGESHEYTNADTEPYTERNSDRNQHPCQRLNDRDGHPECYQNAVIDTDVQSE
jgi:hypothetical protein